MSLDNAKARYRELLASIGRAGLHSQYPNDFEYYACSLELTDSDNNIIEVLVFPVMPESISESNNAISAVKKTATGVVSLYNDTFNPFDISISGTFGRKLRILSNTGFQLYNAIRFSTLKPSTEYDAPVFNVNIKTGYGVIKILERIYKLSHSVDRKGLPVRLYFYNLALNSQYLIDFKQLNFNQSRQNNMIWYYSANFKAIAPAYSIRPNTDVSIINLLASDNINKGITALGDTYRNVKTTRLNNFRF